LSAGFWLADKQRWPPNLRKNEKNTAGKAKKSGGKHKNDIIGKVLS
jgi:hypothetical protein